MDELIEVNGFYTSVKFEGDLKKCSENLRKRLVLLGESEVNFSDEWSRLEKAGVEIDRCICGHKIKYQFAVVSNLTGKKAVIGSSCIRKFKSDSLNSQLRELKKVICETCDKSVLDMKAHEKTNKHIMMLNSRECLDCVKRIMNTEPHWKTRCFKCYRIYN